MRTPSRKLAHCWHMACYVWRMAMARSNRRLGSNHPSTVALLFVVAACGGVANRPDTGSDPGKNVSGNSGSDEPRTPTEGRPRDPESDPPAPNGSSGSGPVVMTAPGYPEGDFGGHSTGGSGFVGSAGFGGDYGGDYGLGGDAGGGGIPYGGYGFGGAGGRGNYPHGGGSAGGPSVSSSCESPVTTTLSDWQPRTADEASATQLLSAARSLLPGHWHGFVASPWVPNYSVTVDFTSSGYSAHCDQNSDYEGGSGCCRAFYYGTDMDTPIKTWKLTSVNEDGTLNGLIDIAFCTASSCLPTWQGELHNLDYDATQSRIRFEFSTSDGYGPLKFELEREP